MLSILNMLKFWIYNCSEYSRVFNRQALHSVLYMPEYTLTEFWIHLGFWKCQDSEYGRVLNIQELHRALNMLQYGWICLNRTWIYLNMSEFTIIDRVLNMSQTIHSARSLYKLMISYWKMSVFRTMSKIKDRALWKNNYSFKLFLQNKPSLIFERVLHMYRFHLCHSSEYSRIEFWISRITQGLSIFINMTGFWKCVWMQLWKGSKFSRISRF